MSQFYTELGNAVHARGYFLSASVPSRIRDFPPFNPFSDPFDYSAIGAAVDQFIVMLYNEQLAKRPGPVVSSGWMNKVVGYTLTKMPANKVVAAISVFGFDFDLQPAEIHMSHTKWRQNWQHGIMRRSYSTRTPSPRCSHTQTSREIRMKCGLKTAKALSRKCGWHGSRASAASRCGGSVWRIRQCGRVSSPTS